MFECLHYDEGTLAYLIVEYSINVNRFTLNMMAITLKSKWLAFWWFMTSILNVSGFHLNSNGYDFNSFSII